MSAEPVSLSEYVARLTATADGVIALRPAGVARALSISERTADQWIAAGILPSFKQGGVVLVPVAELREWASRKARAEGWR